jgi:YD repeat-containing protein
LTWRGKELATHTSNGVLSSYSYNEDEIRTSKTHNGTTTTYDVVGSTIIAQTAGNKTYVFMYDGLGDLIGFKDLSTGTNYFYLKNLQGDIVKIIDTNKIVIAT